MIPAAVAIAGVAVIVTAAAAITASIEKSIVQVDANGRRYLIAYPAQDELETKPDIQNPKAVETCTTVEGGMGACVSLATCAPYITLLQHGNTDAAALRQLRDANCGYRGNDPYVCCPLPAHPTTPPAVTPDESISSSDFITTFPVPPVCGFSNISSIKLIGRINADVDAFPWMTLLGYRGRQGGSTHWLCGGTLISQHHVLTAAHCIDGGKEDLYVVRLGNITRNDEGITPIEILIKNKIKHENYNMISFTNDIGILVLERDVEFTDQIRPICIPTRLDLRANSFVDYHLLFWANTEFRDAPDSHQQVIQMPVLNNSCCIQEYAHAKAQVIDERVMCVRFKKDSIRPLQGDGGTPLMQPDFNPVDSITYFYQIGMVSYGPLKCKEVCLPDIFTRVTYFLPWLHKQVLGHDE